MKKVFLTTTLAFATMIASAQFMAVTTVDVSGDEWEVSQLKDNLGIGYSFDKVTVGLVKNGEDYDFFGRYNMKEGYLSMQTATDTTANMTVGVGYSFSLGKSFYVEPNYSIPVKEDDNGERNGEFKVGVAYRF